MHYKKSTTSSTPATDFEVAQMAHANGSPDTLEKHQYEVRLIIFNTVFLISHTL